MNPLDVKIEVPFNGLTPAEAERLTKLSEECAEVVLVICKILRHGYESKHPHMPKWSPTNRAELEKELGHVDAALALLTAAGDVHGRNIMAASRLKLGAQQQYLHHQTPRV